MSLGLKKARQRAEDHGRGDAAGSGLESTGEGAQQPVLGNSLLYALGQGVAEAREGNGGSGAGKVHQVFYTPAAPSTTPATT